MNDEWKSVESVAKNDKGEYMALVGGQWIPAKGGAKNDQGQYMAYGFEAPSITKKSSPVPEKSYLEQAWETTKKEVPEAMKAMAKAPASVLSGMAGSTAGDIAGVATGKQPLVERIKRSLSYDPNNPYAQMLGKTLGLPASGWQQMGELAREKISEAGHPEAGTRVGSALSLVPQAVGVPIGKRASAPLKGSVESPIPKIQPLREEAKSQMESAIQQAQKGHEMAATREQQLAQRIEQQSQSQIANIKRLNEKLKETPAKETQSLADTGNELRKGVLDITKSASDRRSAYGREMFDKVRESAEAKEAQGNFVDTTEVQKYLNKELKDAKATPSVFNELNKMLTGVSEEATKQQPLSFVDFEGAPLFDITKSGIPRTFAQLEMLRRYLNDVGYSRDLEGFDAITRGVARDAAKKLESAMEKHTPELAEFKAGWKKLSRPLDGLSTKAGKLIGGMEGGMSKEGFWKTPSENLVKNIFSNTENIKIYEDLLSGGVEASPEARIAAQDTISTVATKYFEEQIRQDKAGKILEDITGPSKRSVMEALPPSVERALKRPAEIKYSRESSIQERIGKEEQFAKESAKMRERQRRNIEKGKELKARIDNLNSKFARNPETGLKQYETLFNELYKDGFISKESANTVHRTLENLSSKEKKAEFIKGVSTLGIYTLFGYAGYKYARFMHEIEK